MSKTIEELRQRLEKAEGGKPSKPILGYFNHRGMGMSLRLQLVYHGVDFEDRNYVMGDEMGSPNSWKDVKQEQNLDFPNLPYFKDTDGTNVTETLAIHEYLADKFEPAMLGSTPEAKARINMLAGVFSPIRWDITIQCIKASSKKEVADSMFERVDPFFKELGDFKFVAGQEISWLDFFFFEGLELFNWISDGTLYTKYPTVGAYA